MRLLPLTILSLCLCSSLLGCKDEVKNVAAHGVNPGKVPTMVSHDVNTVISDSGHVRYRITTPLWQMFEDAEPPHWIFPKSVTAQELDKSFKPITTIRCDSAYYDERTQIWSLNGNVRISTADNQLILTNQMYWNQDAHKLYSESFIHVEREARVIEGYGYESNEDFTTYRLNKVMAIFPIEEDRFPRGE